MTTDIRTLSGRSEAQEIYEHILIAYWQGETPERPGYHMEQVHKEFLGLAEQLGYDVARKVAEAPISDAWQPPIRTRAEQRRHDMERPDTREERDRSA